MVVTSPEKGGKFESQNSVSEAWGIERGSNTSKEERGEHNERGSHGRPA